MKLLIFHRILAWGKNPIIHSFVSFTFIKTVSFILTKVLMHAYFLALAVKSLVFYSTLWNDDIGLDKSGRVEVNHMLSLYYRGIYKSPQTLSFEFVTLVAPLLILCVLFLPTIIYVLILNIRYSQNETKVIEKAVLFVYPICTNMYFFEPKCNSSKISSKMYQTAGRINRKCLKKSTSCPELSANTSIPIHRQESKSISVISWKDTASTLEEPEFSLFHSNVLYMFFFIGTLIMFGLEMALQTARKSNIAPPITKMFLGILFFNLVLWLDFNRNMTMRTLNNETVILR